MSIQNEYLAAQVLTATPQKLHLMLIDGAIRFGRQAVSHWDDDAQHQKREEALTRLVKIAGEMLVNVRQSAPPVRQQLTAVYTWLFQTLTEAKILTDRGKLDESLELLAIERETWSQVCERLGSESEATATIQPSKSSPPDELPAGAGISLEA